MLLLLLALNPLKHLKTAVPQSILMPCRSMDNQSPVRVLVLPQTRKTHYFWSGPGAQESRYIEIPYGSGIPGRADLPSLCHRLD